MAVLMAYMGDRLGLYRALDEHGPGTSAQIAAKSGLDERYVREWLSAVAAAGYVDYDAAGEVFCIASDESLTVGELARGIGAAIGRPVRPIAIPGLLLAISRWIVWNRAIAAMVPAAGRLAFWRLSLIISDGFWFDTTKFRRVYTKPLKNLQEGLRSLK